MDPTSPGKPDASGFLDLLDEYHIGLYGGVEVLRARLRPELSGSDPAVLAALASWGGEIHVEPRGDEVDVILIRPSGPPRHRWWLHGLLLLATLVTTLAAGALLEGIDATRTLWIRDDSLPIPTGLDLGKLWSGAWFGLPFLGILFAHEAGHYLAARRHRIPVSLPYFLPFIPWYSLVGTLGAFIKSKAIDVEALWHQQREHEGGHEQHRNQRHAAD